MEHTKSDPRDLVGEVVPSLHARTAIILSGGWDSDTIEVDETWIFRFPKRPQVAEAMRTEITLLPELGPVLPIRIPQIEWSGMNPVFMSYRKLAGAPILRQVATPEVAREVARFLDALHAFPTESASHLGVPGGDLSQWKEDAKAFADRLGDEVLPLVRQPVAARLLANWRGTAAKAQFVPSVVHADLGPEHILCSHHQVSGVIDWSDVHIGDPAVDFGWLMHGVGSTFGVALFDAYSGLRRRDGGVAQRALIYHMLGPWHEVLYGQEVGDDAYIESGLRGITQRLPRS